MKRRAATKPGIPTRSATCSPSYQRLNSASSAAAMSMKVINMPSPRRPIAPLRSSSIADLAETPRGVGHIHRVPCAKTKPALFPLGNQPGLGGGGGLPFGERGQREQRIDVALGQRRQLD